MAFAQRLSEIRTGFRPAFWVANISEMFERLAFYGPQAVLAIYLHEKLSFSVEDTGILMGYFGLAAFSLPVISGTLADRFGFRRSLAFAFGISGVGYFLMGSLSAHWMMPFLERVSLYHLALAIFLMTAIGPSFVKPCVLGTTAKSSDENVRSIGYSLYFTMMNLGATLGPVTAFLVRRSIGIEYVFLVSALASFLMALTILIFYREPGSLNVEKVQSVGRALKNAVTVLRNGRFMVLLFIFAMYMMVYWQFFITMPLYVRGYVNPKANVDLIIFIDPLMIGLFQMVVTSVTRKIPALHAMTLGLVVAAVSMLVLSLHASISVVALALGITAIGEMIHWPRFYEYISRSAPESLQGLYMGYAFLPAGVGYLLGGRLGGFLVHHYGEMLHRPEQIWRILAAIGFITALAMWGFARSSKLGELAPSVR